MKTLFFTVSVITVILLGRKMQTQTVPTSVTSDPTLPTTNVNEIINDTRQMNYFNYKNTYRSVKYMYVAPGEGC